MGGARSIRRRGGQVRSASALNDFIGGGIIQPAESLLAHKSRLPQPTIGLPNHGVQMWEIGHLALKSQLPQPTQCLLFAGQHAASST